MRLAHTSHREILYTISVEEPANSKPPTPACLGTLKAVERNYRPRHHELR